jgi:hypothetical protein
MHDYKFRQSDLSFKKPKKTWHKSLLRAVGLALAAGVIYAVIQLAITGKGDSGIPETDSDVIPLPLPPHVEPEEGSPPDGSTGDRPADIGSNE